jgi:soluble lytic murein transglycosylase
LYPFWLWLLNLPILFELDFLLLYLAYLNKRLQNDHLLVVASYNAGPNAVARWANNDMEQFKASPDRFVETIPYDQTRHYVHHVFEGMWNYHQLYHLD